MVTNLNISPKYVGITVTGNSFTELKKDYRAMPYAFCLSSAAVKYIFSPYNAEKIVARYVQASVTNDHRLSPYYKTFKKFSF